MKRLSTLVYALLLTQVGVMGAPIPAMPKQLDLATIEKKAEQDFPVNDRARIESRYVAAAMNKMHYSNKSLGEVDPKAFLKNYIRELDPAHLFFYAQDLALLEKKYASSMVQDLIKGNPAAAGVIYVAFRERFDERIDWVLKRLEDPFDFNTEGSYEPDRKESKWPETILEAEDLWEGRLKYEIINERLSLEVTSKKRKEEADKQADKEAVETKKSEKEAKVVEQKKSSQDILEEATEVVMKRYKTLKTNIEQLKESEIQEFYLSAFTQRFDTHSIFISADAMEDFSMSIHNSLVGIGAMLSLEDNYCVIKELLPGGPAEKSNDIKAQDRIVGVGQGKDGEIVDVIGMKLRDTTKLIRGKKGTKVRLLIQPSGADKSERKEVIIVRDEIKLTANLATGKLFEVPDGKVTRMIGYIDLPSFYGGMDDRKDTPSTTKDVEELINKMKKMGMEALILDMRRNGGGLFVEAIDLAGLFIPVGPVLQVRDSDGQIQEFMDTDESIAWKGPLIVMQSRFSASASEIVAGALKNLNRAILVGDSSTHGKGTVQLVINVSRPLFANLFAESQKMGTVKVTTQKWYLPDGQSIQLNGIKSDIVVPSIYEHLPIAESDLSNPLSADTIKTPPWPHKHLDSYTDTITPRALESLRKKSEVRQKSLEEFKVLQENIAFFKERQDKEAFSLNYNKRLQERKADIEAQDEIDDRVDKLEQERFPYKEVILDAQAKAQSKDAQSNEEAYHETLDRTFDEFDIYRRESLRLMVDYLNSLEYKKEEPKASTATAQK